MRILFNAPPATDYSIMAVWGLSQMSCRRNGLAQTHAKKCIFHTAAKGIVLGDGQDAKQCMHVSMENGFTFNVEDWRRIQVKMHQIVVVIVYLPRNSCL